MSTVDLYVGKFLTLGCNKNVDLVPSKTNHLIHRKNDFVYIELLYYFIS